MNSSLLLDRFTFDDRQLEAVCQVGHHGLAIATERYGSGFPEYRGGTVRKLGFNNGRHGRTVGNDAARLGAVLGFSKTTQELLRTTGFVHDIRQQRRGDDERESAEWIERQLCETGVIPHDAARLSAMAILGTLPLFDSGGRLIDQTANRMEFSCTYDELFVKAIASADLGEVYTPIGPYSSHMLYAQRMGVDAGEVPDAGNLLDFQAQQILFLEDYRYPLLEAHHLFATHHSEVIRYAHYVYAQLIHGEIETWQQLIDQDLTFMSDPRRGGWARSIA